MLCFRFTSLLLLALTALTLVSCAIVNPPPMEVITDEHPRMIADAENTDELAQYYERKLGLPKYWLSPAISYDHDLQEEAFQVLLNSPNTRFMSVARSEQATFYAVPLQNVINGLPRRRIAFLQVEHGGRTTPQIITAVKPENIPGKNHNLWSLLEDGAQERHFHLGSYHGGLYL